MKQARKNNFRRNFGDLKGMLALTRGNRLQYLWAIISVGVASLMGYATPLIVRVTVDSVPRPLPQPFTVIASQNPVGSAGTQLLPESQLDRFMMRLSIGYPTLDQEVKILKQTEGARPVDSLRQVSNLEDVLQMQQEVAAVHVADDLYRYVASLCAATRQHPLIRLGASPRAGGALIRASRASAWLAGRDYIIPGDVALLYYSVLEHRITPDPQARLSDRDAHTLLTEAWDSVPQPKVV